MTFDIEWVDDVRGFLDREEGDCLYRTALNAAHSGPCLEIGSYCGKSTLYIGSGCKSSGGVLFSIDHHRGSEEQQPGEGYFDPALFDYRTFQMDTFPEFRAVLQRADIEDTVVPLVSKSEIVARSWSTPLGMVFIDGGHSFESAFIDYACWAPHVLPGGYLAIHDIFENPDDGGQAPYRIYSLALSSGLFKEVERVKTLVVLQRLSCGEVRKDLMSCYG
jgi:predicted O-methyltransferase YrrM